ncbi:MAG: sigma-70 family RNA polymerase sigma factor [Pyrinomonadaceae bacterium]|nr:sigma-70 family RNA polymerase sigma factor [Pyrinomonadaceae bacterium]
MCNTAVKENDVQPMAAITTRLNATPAITGAMGVSDLETLFREHHEQILRTAYRITGSMTDAEDVLQTIFLRLASNKEQRDFAPSPASYLRRAAVNAALDLMRRRTRAQLIPFDSIEATHELKISGLSPEQEQDGRELRVLIRQAIAKLGERAAIVFALRYIEGYDNNQIAELLGTSQMVIAVTLHRARTRLRREISQYLEKHHEA